jgi:acyl-CoA-binding protein
MLIGLTLKNGDMNGEGLTNIEKPTAFEIEIRSQRRKLLAEMEMRGLSEIDALDDIVDYADEMKAKYPDTYQNTRAYHVLIGSTVPSRAGELRDDFDGKDSALIFLAGLRAKYLEHRQS